MSNQSDTTSHELWTNERAEKKRQEYVAREKQVTRKRLWWCTLLTAALFPISILVTSLAFQWSYFSAIVVGALFLVVMLTIASEGSDTSTRNKKLGTDVADVALATWTISEVQMDEIIQMAKDNPAVKVQLEEWMKENPAPIFRGRDLEYLIKIPPPSNELLQKNKLPDLIAAIQVK